MNRGFKPMLAPNNKVDYNDIDWNKRIQVPEHWDVSVKLDGIRLEIFFDREGHCTIFTRSMKPFRSVFIQKLAFQLRGSLRDCVVEAEIYNHEMRFNELQHFILSIDVGIHLSRLRRLEDKVLNAGLFDDPQKWPFPGRSAGWLCRYDHAFTVNVFDIHRMENQRWNDRFKQLNDDMFKLNNRNNMFKLCTQAKFDDIEDIHTWYRLVLEDGGEGLILKHDSNRYKYGCVTLNQRTLFKMKDEFRVYRGKILNVEQGTMVDPMIETSINELGYSVTSQRAEDRMPNGKAKGFLVEIETGKTLTVTLKGFNDVEKKVLLKSKDMWVGQHIDFLAMKPTKVGGVPRQAKYINVK